MEETNRKRRILKVLMMIMNSEDEDSSSDDEAEILSVVKRNSNMDILLTQLALLPQKRIRILNYVGEVVPSYTDEDFKMHFRLNRQTFEFVCQRFEQSDIYSQLRLDKKFEASTYILLFLWFAGHEACSFRDVADRFNTSLSSVHRIIHRVTMFMSSLSPEVIRWPKMQNMESSSVYFEMKSGLSKIIGNYIITE